MDKFCLTWNGFQVNTSKSINALKLDTSFVDVTLVSDEGKHISAHKVVLSMASEFFNDGLKKMNHPNPMIFLPEFDTKTLSSIIDYVYDGEVQLFQEELDSFLDAAQKLKINGLLSSPAKDEINEESATENEYIEKNSQDYHMNSEKQIIGYKPEATIANNIQKTNSRDTTIAIADNENAKKAVDELILKCDDGWKCKECGKMSSDKSKSRLHVEIHINNLSFPCNICFVNFHGRNALSKHKQKKHYQNKQKKHQKLNK